MPDNIPKESRHSQRVAEIPLPDGEILEAREIFAEKTLAVCDRTARRMDFPTVYVGGFPYVKRNVSLRIIPDRAKRKNQPQKPRRAR
jgi:hypothetical protein